MAEQDKPEPSESDDALQKEIRQGRKFSVNEALGRMGGQGMMKGASPVSPRQQAELEIELYLRDHISDASGVLPVVLFRYVKQSTLLLEGAEKPMNVLAACVRRVLDSPDLIKELVRLTDMEWGGRLGERPLFEKEGQPPHPEDPYTVESVRATLQRLLDKLATGGASDLKRTEPLR